MQEKANIINKSDIQRAIGMKGPFGKLVASLVFRIMELDKVNETYKKYHMYEGPEFSQKILEDLNITWELPEEDLKNLPEGPFITVSNHAFGGVDGLMISHIIGSRKADYKILTNFILSMIPTLKDTFLPVNPFKNGETDKKSFSGIRMAIEHLNNGGSLGLFPAGAVSTYMKPEDRTAVGKGKIVEDWPWPNNMSKLIRNAGVPVVPVYFDGQDSWSFHALGKIKPILRTARLVHELFNKHDQCIRIRIGKPVMPSEFADYEDLKSLGQYLRSRVFALEAEMPVNLTSSCTTDTKNAKPVAERGKAEDIIADIEGLKDKMLFESGEYKCFLADYADIPHAMIELGRLREEAFRAIGEGTSQPSDTDGYDEYYKHLIIWNDSDKKIAGAYRLGIGRDIFASHGIKGFYTDSLVKYCKAAEDLLPDCIELGRSFVALEYQRETMAFQMLFKGLLYAALKYPEAKGFIGPVSISNSYPKFYQSLMVYYLGNYKAYRSDTPVAIPTTPFEPDYLRVNPEQLLKGKCDTLEKFDRLLFNISKGEYRLPPLVKRYFKAGAQLICFNVDPLFNYSLDGLIFQPFKGYPESELLPLIKDLDSDSEKQTILNRFK